MVIVESFPPPPALIADALERMGIVQSGDRDAIDALGDRKEWQRPWEPAACSDQTRHHLWLWLDDVAAWLNRQYAWRTSQLIPDCWPWHPHIANELPALACLRVIAGEQSNPDALEEWHRHTLPEFLNRLALRLGESGCRTGRHVDWPAAARYQQSRDEQSVGVRQDLFGLDTNQKPRRLRPVANNPT
jgi:hypothetical protein